jgi:hypothetical protein
MEDEKTGQVARMGKTRNAYKILVGKREGKRPLGRPRHSWQYNIRMDLRETEWEGVDSVHLAQDMDQQRALVNTIMNIGVLKKVTKF